MPKITGISSVIFLLLWASQLSASQDISPTTPLQDTAYTVQESLELLDSFGCIPTYLKGDALKSENELKRLVSEATTLCKKEELSQQAITVLQALDHHIQRNDPSQMTWKTLHFHYPTLKAEYLYFHEDRRPANRSDIGAITGPWSAYRSGHNFSNGSNFLLEGEAGFSLGQWFDFQVTPALLSTSADSFFITPHAGHVKFTLKNIELKVGRMHQYWGQNYGGRMVLFGNNAKPLESIQLGSPHPLSLPWIFRHLGPFQYRLSLANLDRNHNFPNPYLLSGRVMFKPTPNLEFGLTRTVQFGGRGAPSFFFLEPLAELTGFRPRDGWIFNIPFSRGAAGGSTGSANNAMVFDFVLKFPSLRYSEVFFEWYNEDPIDPIELWLDDSVFRLGFWVPRLSDDGRWQLLAEAAYSGEIVYSHTTFTSGLTNQGRILGFDTGTKTFQLKALVNYWTSPTVKLWGSQTITVAKPLLAGSNELRSITQAGLTSSFSKRFHVSASGGFQIIDKYNFSNISRLSPMLNASLRYTY